VGSTVTSPSGVRTTRTSSRLGRDVRQPTHVRIGTLRCAIRWLPPRLVLFFLQQVGQCLEVFRHALGTLLAGAGRLFLLVLVRLGDHLAQHARQLPRQRVVHVVLLAPRDVDRDVFVVGVLLVVGAEQSRQRLVLFRQHVQHVVVEQLLLQLAAGGAAPPLGSRRLLQQLLFDVVLGNEELLGRSEEHTSELQSRENLVCRLLLE